MTPQPITPSDELLTLQRAAYAVEAGLIGDDRLPALSEDLAGLVAAGLTWLGVVDGERLVGAVGYTETAAVVDVHRLVVAPDAARRGIGRTLVTEVLRLAGGRRVDVATGRDNAPARALYEGLGFSWLEDLEVLPGLWVSRYALVPASADDADEKRGGDGEAADDGPRDRPRAPGRGYRGDTEHHRDP